MRLHYYAVLLLIASFVVAPQQSYAISGPSFATTEIQASDSEVAVQKLTKKEQRQQLRTQRKTLRKQLKAASTNLVLLVILTIIPPLAPLAMYLYEGDTTSRFWISLVLTLLGVLPGIIYNLVIFLSES